MRGLHDGIGAVFRGEQIDIVDDLPIDLIFVVGEIGMPNDFLKYERQTVAELRGIVEIADLCQPENLPSENLQQGSGICVVE